MYKLYQLPQKYLIISVPITLIAGFIVGSFFDTSFLKQTILVATIIMIYATMVGLNFKQLTSSQGNNVLFTSLVINFIAIPLIAYLIGISLLKNEPLMFAGLALSALLPTSGMTISWTMIQKGNVPLAIKLTVLGLIIGSVLTPWYLLVMVGQFVNIQVLETMKTILLVVFLPMILGQLTFLLLLRKYSRSDFQKNIKPLFSPLSVWGMLYIVFISVSMRANMMAENLQLILLALLVLILFYAINYLISTLAAIKLFDRADGIALVNGTVLRNLSIAIGIAATTFGVEAALLVTLAFIVQQQSITIYARLSGKYWFKEVGASK